MTSFYDRSALTANFCSSFKIKLPRRTHKLSKTFSFSLQVLVEAIVIVSTADVKLDISIPTRCIKIVFKYSSNFPDSFLLSMNQSEFSVPEAAGNSNASVTKESAALFLSPLPQFPLGSFACSSLAELVFVFRLPHRLTEKRQLTVYRRA